MTAPLSLEELVGLVKRVSDDPSEQRATIAVLLQEGGHWHKVIIAERMEKAGISLEYIRAATGLVHAKKKSPKEKTSPQGRTNNRHVRAEQKLMKVTELLEKGATQSDLKGQRLTVPYSLLPLLEKNTGVRLLQLIDEGQSFSQAYGSINVSPHLASRAIGTVHGPRPAWYAQRPQKDLLPKKRVITYRIRAEQNLVKSTEAVEKGATQSDLKGQNLGLPRHLLPLVDQNTGVRLLQRIDEGHSFAQAYQSMKLSYDIATRAIGAVHGPRPVWYRRQPLKSVHHKDSILRMIEQNPTLEAIGAELGVTREGARLYVDQLGLTSLRHEVKRKYQDEKIQRPEQLAKLRANLVALLEQKVTADSESPEWPLHMARLYRTKTSAHPAPISRPRLTNLFAAYQHARRTGENASYGLMGEQADMCTMTARSVIRKMNLPSFNWTVPFKPRDATAGEAAIRAAAVGLTTSDIAYFQNTAYNVVTARLGGTKIQKEADYRSRLSAQFLSTVYEAADAGFTPDEISTLTERRISRVNAALAIRDRVEPIFIAGLRVLDNDETITTPYRVKRNT